MLFHISEHTSWLKRKTTIQLFREIGVVIQILSLDMRKASKTVLIPPGTDFCTQLHYIHIAVFSSGKFFENLGSTRGRPRVDPRKYFGW